MIKEDVKEIRYEFPHSFAHDWVDDIIVTQETIGYKAAFIEYKNGKLKPCIIKLMILGGRTKHFDSFDEKYGKHRCSSAKVIGFLSYYTGKEIKVTKAYSIFFSDFCYELGWYVSPSYFSSDYTTCGGGIHYFNFLEAARCYMDSVLWDIKREFMNNEKNSCPQESEIIRAVSIKQRKNVLPAYDFSRRIL